MRALRERPYHHQRRARMPQGKQTGCFAPRGMRHWRRKSDGIHYGVWGASPSAGVQRAGGRPLPRGTGAQSPESVPRMATHPRHTDIKKLRGVGLPHGALAPVGLALQP